ncbi:hypothetical protein BDZ94DRAFT_95630 [Collybia nuda]|uniref:Uncharacterized protein n=1 Tax=Collybia nuda TaxID=64659 RepID=A0A9P6CNT7_9AGAR|nr:hypothetical protein BDZ94DRAFT_95630 [Collybia nuda]
MKYSKSNIQQVYLHGITLLVQSGLNGDIWGRQCECHLLFKLFITLQDLLLRIWPIKAHWINISDRCSILVYTIPTFLDVNGHAFITLLLFQIPQDGWDA